MRALPLFVLLALAGCGNKSSDTNQTPSWQEKVPVDKIKAAVDKQRPALEAVRAKLKKAVDAAKAHPELKPLAGPTGDPTSLLFVDEDEHAYDPKALYCTPSDTKRWLLFHAMDDPTPQSQFDFEQLQAAIPIVLGAKQALVCRTTRLDPLVIDEKAKSFTGGYFEGECRLYDLETTSYVGGFAVKQGISDKLSYANYNPSANSFSTDLSSAVSTTLNTTLWGPNPPKEALYYGCNFPDKNPG